MFHVTTGPVRLGRLFHVKHRRDGRDSTAAILDPGGGAGKDGPVTPPHDAERLVHIERRRGPRISPSASPTPGTTRWRRDADAVPSEPVPRDPRRRPPPAPHAERRPHRRPVDRSTRGALAPSPARSPASSRWPTRRAASARPPPRSTSAPAWPTSGYRTLVVDLDPQGNATTGLGINTRDLETSMYDVIMHDVPLEDCIEPHLGPQPLRGTGQPRPRRCRDRAGPRVQSGAAAQARHRRGARRLRLRPHRLPAVARTAHRQRPRGGHRGARSDPVRVLRARRARPAAAQRRPGAART